MEKNNLVSVILSSDCDLADFMAFQSDFFELIKKHQHIVSSFNFALNEEVYQR